MADGRVLSIPTQYDHRHGNRLNAVRTSGVPECDEKQITASARGLCPLKQALWSSPGGPSAGDDEAGWTTVFRVRQRPPSVGTRTGHAVGVAEPGPAPHRQHHQSAPTNARRSPVRPDRRPQAGFPTLPRNASASSVMRSYAWETANWTPSPCSVNRSTWPAAIARTSGWSANASGSATVHSNASGQDQ